MHKLSFSVVHPAEYALGITVAGATLQTAFLHQAQQRNKNNNIWPQYNTRTCKSSSFQTARFEYSHCTALKPCLVTRYCYIPRNTRPGNAAISVFLKQLDSYLQQPIL